jgi:hypothetical protein
VYYDELSKYNDTHHLFFPRKEYRTASLKTLREHPYCKVSIPKKTTHRTLHIILDGVPTPRGVNAIEATKQLDWLMGRGAISLSDHPSKRLEILAALFDCADQPTADALRQQADILRFEYVHAPSK